MNTAFGALTDSLSSQRHQLEAYATQQQAASSAMLQHTQSAIAVARQHLHEANGATTSCQQNLDQTLSAQSSALSAFDESFSHSMQEEQVTVCIMTQQHWSAYAVKVILLAAFAH